MEKKRERIYYLDILRILSIAAVIFVHGNAENVQNMKYLGTDNWWMSTILNTSLRWSVPVFFMMSGALLLNTDGEEEGLGSFFKKKFLRIGIPFLVWSVIYSIIKHYYYFPDYPWPYEMLWIIPKEILFDKVYYHFWFVYVIFAVYLVTPILQSLVRHISEKKMKYFLIMWAVIGIFYETFRSLFSFITNDSIYISIFNIPWFTGYIGYFVLGYYINKTQISTGKRLIIYIMGALSLIATPILTYYFSIGQENLYDMFLGHFSITTFFSSMAIFTWFKHRESLRTINKRLGKLIASISNSTFGIYLIHSLVQLAIINYFTIDMSKPMLELFGVYVLNTLLAFIFSYIIVKILSLNKFLRTILVG